MFELNICSLGEFGAIANLILAKGVAKGIWVKNVAYAKFHVNFIKNGLSHNCKKSF